MNTMTLTEKLAEITDKNAIIGIVYENFRILDFKKDLDEAMKTKYKDLASLEVDYASHGCSYGQKPETLVVSLKKPEEESKDEGEEDPVTPPAKDPEDPDTPPESSTPPTESTDEPTEEVTPKAKSAKKK